MHGRFQRAFLFFVVALIPASYASAQSADRIDELLAQESAQTGSAAYLILAAADLIDESAPSSRAIEYAIGEGMLPPDTEADDALTFGRFSYLLTRSFDIPGGVMYRLVPGPRYAAREVVFQGWSRKRRDTGELLDGETVVRILSIYLNEQGGTR